MKDLKSRSLGSGSGVSNKEPISVLIILYLVSYKSITTISISISFQCHDHPPNYYVHGVDKMSIKIIFPEFETFFSLFI